MAIRSTMHRVGGVMLEKLLNCDLGYDGASIDCGRSHHARFIDYRTKEVVTAVSPVQIQRAYYHCEACGCGKLPKDEQLDVVDTSFSPAVRRMMGHVGGSEAFEEGQRDLESLAGVIVSTKAVERVSEGIGEQLEVFSKGERQMVLSGKLLSFEKPSKLYICVDGTGVPMIAKETRGRRGKDPVAGAKTREVKLGCVFTQTACDAKGYPVRDKDSTSYVGAIETAEEFGWRIYAEAIRRGLEAAKQVIFIADGAPWIWKIADEHFPGTLQIVDLFHARQHLANLGKAALVDPIRLKAWTSARFKQLDAGNIKGLVHSIEKLQSLQSASIEEIRRTIDYFQTNAHRMRYAKFRKQGLFVGSGVVEAGCKTIIGHRLKQSGMHWTVRGANSIIALRCCQQSGRWEEFWELRSAG